MRRNRIIVSVSLYPPLHEKLNELLEYMRENDKQGSINRIDRFFKKFCDSPVFNASEISSYCGYCMGLRDGHISKCIDSLTIGYLNSKYNLNLPETAGLDIYDPDISLLEFPSARFNPPPLGGRALAAFSSSTNCDKIWHQEVL